MTALVEHSLSRSETLETRCGPVVVAVDGSALSDRAVTRAAAIAVAADTDLLLVGSFAVADRRELRTADAVLRADAYLVHGSTPAEEILRVAAESARARGVRRVVRRVVSGSLATALIAVADETGAHRLVVPDHGVGTRQGRWFGTLSGALTRRGVEVLAVTEGRSPGPQRPTATATLRARTQGRLHCCRRLARA
ncbi:universal stress protein [Nocardia sp. NPDC052566]|uniref:universal stress protein n=1 Tax=Nocardia sp. NPDC052566 TaxID=3364330 RepID=UPI0037CAED70